MNKIQTYVMLKYMMHSYC